VLSGKAIYTPHVVRFAPCPLLQTRIETIDVVEHGNVDTCVMPSTNIVLGLQFQGRVRAGERLLSPAGVTGLQHQARTYSYLDGAGSVLVTFKPQGVTSLGVSAKEITNANVALDELLTSPVTEELCEQLSKAPSHQARVHVVERWLLQLPFARDALVTRALERLEADNAPSIAALSRELNLSERQLERRFLERVGVSPKRFAKLRRFERTLPLLATAPTLARAAQLAGYFDQSHFVRDFQSFTGISPSQWLYQR
jgi:AraC-like DNA-binding protein